MIALNFVSPTYYWNDFEAESETGEAINDAIYKRNVYAEDTYGVKIVPIMKSYSDWGDGRASVSKPPNRAILSPYRFTHSDINYFL